MSRLAAIFVATSIVGCELALPIHERADKSQPSAAAPEADAGLRTDLIDNMEDHTGRILTDLGRDGSWYTFDDETKGGVIEPQDPFAPTMLDPPRGSSLYAAHFQAHGFTVWGAAMGFDLYKPAGASASEPYDASRYVGFVFWAKVGEGATTTVRMDVPDWTTLEGAGCTRDCGAHHSKELSLSTTWTQISVPFAELVLEGSPPLDRTRLFGVNFVVGTRTTGDVWIDDIAFLEP